MNDQESLSVVSDISMLFVANGQGQPSVFHMYTVVFNRGRIED